MIIILTVAESDLVSANVVKDWDDAMQRVERARRLMPPGGAIYTLVVDDDGIDVIREDDDDHESPTT